MSTSSLSSNAGAGLDQGWSPEPELRDNPPRRIVPSDFTDLNRPNAAMFVGLGGAVLLVGLVLFIVGLNGGRALFWLLGLVLALGGGALVAYYPARVRAHRERAERLIENGVPVMARIVQVQNLTGDSQYGRHVTYMITLPGDTEETRREVKADDRSLPKRIPGPATALVDFSNKDVELYCVLPFKAVSKFSPATSGAGASPTPDPLAGLPTSPQPAAGGAMGTIGGGHGQMGQMGAIPTAGGGHSHGSSGGGQKPTGSSDKLPWEQ